MVAATARPRADYADSAECSRAGTLSSRNEPGFFVNGLGTHGLPEAVHKEKNEVLFGGVETSPGAEQSAQSA